MNNRPAACCIVLLLLILPAGCITQSPQVPAIADHAGPDPTAAPEENPAEETNPAPPAARNAAVNTSVIPLLLTDSDWQTAAGCGWNEDNIRESTALFTGSCITEALLRDGWTVDGMRYEINVLGSRCRRSTHPDAPEDCDWCADGGPTLRLRYRGLLTTVLMAHMEEKTVTRFRTSLPEDSGSVSSGDSDTILFHNGTVVYSFKSC